MACQTDRATDVCRTALRAALLKPTGLRAAHAVRCGIKGVSRSPRLAQQQQAAKASRSPQRLRFLQRGAFSLLSELDDDILCVILGSTTAAAHCTCAQTCRRVNELSRANEQTLFKMHLLRQFVELTATCSPPRPASGLDLVSMGGDGASDAVGVELPLHGDGTIAAGDASRENYRELYQRLRGTLEARGWADSAKVLPGEMNAWWRCCAIGYARGHVKLRFLGYGAPASFPLLVPGRQVRSPLALIVVARDATGADDDEWRPLSDVRSMASARLDQLTARRDTRVEVSWAPQVYRLALEDEQTYHTA